MRMLFVFFALSFMQVHSINLVDSQEFFPYANDSIKNDVFRNVEASENNGVYEVTGEIRSNNSEFYYIAEDGHNELITETKQKVMNPGHSKWSKFSFKLTLQKEMIPENGTVTLYLFVKNNEGKKLQIYPLVLHANPYNEKS